MTPRLIGDAMLDVRASSSLMVRTLLSILPGAGSAWTGAGVARQSSTSGS